MLTPRIIILCAWGWLAALWLGLDVLDALGRTWTAEVYVDGEHRETIERFERVYRHGAFVVLVEPPDHFPRCEVRGRLSAAGNPRLHLVCWGEGWRPVRHGEGERHASVRVEDHVVDVTLDSQQK